MWQYKCPQKGIQYRDYSQENSYCYDFGQSIHSGVLNMEFEEKTFNRYQVPKDQDKLTLYVWQEEHPDNLQSYIYVNAPYVVTNHESLYPTIDGSLLRGGRVGTEQETIEITFNCLKRQNDREDEVIVALEIPYFENVEIYFTKQCKCGKKCG